MTLPQSHRHLEDGSSAPPPSPDAADRGQGGGQREEEVRDRR